MSDTSSDVDSAQSLLTMLIEGFSRILLSSSSSMTGMFYSFFGQGNSLNYSRNPLLVSPCRKYKNAVELHEDKVMCYL